MSNKLKTLSAQQLETFLEEKVGEYLDEGINCEVYDLNTPNIDSEADIALHDERSLKFKVQLSYEDSS